MAKAETIGDVLRHWARVAPQRPVITAAETGLTISYGELEQLSIDLSALFAAKGVARVALFLNNGLAMSGLFLATMACGRTVTPINLLAHASQLAYVIEHCEADLMITSADHLERIEVALLSAARRPQLLVIDPDRIDWVQQHLGAASANAIETERDAISTPLVPRRNGKDIALMMYTSGTTGKPKGALLTHASLIYAAEQLVQWHFLTEQDRVLSALPLYHINGQVVATVTPFLAGGCMVVPRKFSVSTWWQDVQRYQCTWINMVPTIVAYLLQQSQEPGSAERGRRACATVRFGRSASSPLPPEHQQLFEQRFGVPLIEAMGMTESSSVVFCNPMPPGVRKSGSPGVPLGIIAKVVDRNGNELPKYQQGEIWFRGPNLMTGYFKSPEQTADAIDADGWMHSGDLGHRDDDGYFFITGRLKELIIKGGENIAPREIDEALLRHPDVLEAAAVGIAHASYGQDILACVVLRENAMVTPEQLREYCRTELGAFKTPAQIRVLAQLPKGPSGKVQRLQLLD